jgi:S-adenosylmethionine-diacylglycerol 3-amino-3-carboxypropyl transferase
MDAGSGSPKSPAGAIRSSGGEPSAQAGWVEDAARLPLAFAQVREDPRLDVEVAKKTGAGRGDGVRGLMVASGGDTAAVLVASGLFAHLRVVDPNPAQVALTRLKLRLLADAGPRARLEVLGHVPLPIDARRARLAAETAALGVAPGVFGPADVVARDGPDHMGRYERLFAALSAALARVRPDVEALLAHADPAEQARRAAPGTALGRALDDVFEEVFAHATLVRLFGEGATRSPVEPFHLHFARRTRHALATLPAADNPWLHQMLVGRFPAAARYPWLDAPKRAGTADVVVTEETIQAALASAPASSLDFVHLSNVLDWLAPGEASDVLAKASRALRPGGLVILRQLGSTLDVPSLHEGIAWDPAWAAALHARDRSFLYRALHVGRRA